MGNRCFVRMLIVALALGGLSCSAQVLSLGKVTDPVSKRLQKEYFAQLQQISIRRCRASLSLSLLFQPDTGHR